MRADPAPRSEERLRAVRSELAGGATVAEALARGMPGLLNVRSIVDAGSDIRSAVSGIGPVLQPLLDDAEVTDILVNSIRGVWVDRGKGLERVTELTGAFRDDTEVRDMAVRLAAASGQRLDDQSPLVDGTVGSGIRLHAVLPPLAAEGTMISLRVHRRVNFSVEDLADNGMIPRPVLPVLLALVERRANVMISGATGSGKTTLLAGLLSEVPRAERILIIEERQELRPYHPHVVHLQERKANVQGVGAIPMSELVRAALRMRPDRIVLGECRGAEVRDVLAALNTGHEGGWATIHANSAADVPARLTALGALAGLSESTMAAQAVAALDAVVHVERERGSRRVSQIAVLERTRERELAAVEALRWDGTALHRGPSWPKLARRLGMEDVGL